MVRLPIKDGLAILFVLIVVSGSVPSAEGQTLYGTTVTAEWLYPTFEAVLESHEVLVGPGVELPSDLIVNETVLEIDIGESSVRFDFSDGTSWSSDPFNGWRFTVAKETIPPIVDYSIGSISDGVTGLEQTDLGWDTESVWANFSGVTIAGAGDFIVLEINFGVELFADNFESGDCCEWSGEVPMPGPPCANFVFSIVDRTVDFLNTSRGAAPLSYLWNFGDGSLPPYRFDSNPTHTYSAPGTYNVSLTVANAFGTDSVTKPVTVGN